MSGKGKDPAPFLTPGAVHRGVGHASMAEEIPIVGRSMEHEGIVDKLHRRQFLHHHLERFNALNYRGGSRRIGGRNRPHSKTSRHQSGSNGTQTDLAHLNSPVQSARPQSRLVGVCRTRSSNDVMAITKWSIADLEKKVPLGRGLELGESNEAVVLCQSRAAVL
jgi:hypothetical protein